MTLFSCRNFLSQQKNLSNAVTVHFTTTLSQANEENISEARSICVESSNDPSICIYDLEESDIERIELEIKSVDSSTNEETSYVFDESSETPTKKVYNSTDEETAISLFQKDVIKLETGDWSFYVDLYAKNANEELVVVQSGEVIKQTLTEGSNEVFIKTNYKDTGDLLVTYTWDKYSDNYNYQVAIVRMALYTGTYPDLTVSKYWALTEYQPSVSEVSGDTTSESGDTTTESGDTTSDTGDTTSDTGDTTSDKDYLYTVSDTRIDIPNGSYYLNVCFYDEYGTELSNLIYPIDIYGYKTTADLSLSDNYDSNYTITYNLDGGSKVEGKESRYVESINKYSTLILPDASCIYKEGYTFKGWYFTTDDEGEYKELTIISADDFASKSSIELTALWEETKTSVEGQYSIDDYKLTFEVSEMEPFTRNSGKLSVSILKASDNTQLTQDDLKSVDVKLYFGSNDVDKYCSEQVYSFEPAAEVVAPESSDSTSESQSSSFYYFEIVNPLDCAGTYTLSITASIMGSSSLYYTSQNYDITVEDKFVYTYELSSENPIENTNIVNDLDLVNKFCGTVDLTLEGAGVEMEPDSDEETDTSTLTLLSEYLKNCKKLKAVNIDLSGLENITKVKSSTFYSFAIPINSLKLPEGITTIESEAFKYASLYSIELPSTLKTIGDYAFYSSQISSIELNSSALTRIGASSFQYTALSSVVLPSTLEVLDRSAFDGTEITTLTIPQSIIAFHMPKDVTFDVEFEEIEETENKTVNLYYFDGRTDNSTLWENLISEDTQVSDDVTDGYILYKDLFTSVTDDDGQEVPFFKNFLKTGTSSSYYFYKKIEEVAVSSGSQS